ncbi:MAG: InlB B-repeat-containing protein [Clostridia bacterium]|nr:InlB B-repeat-containing protein [Clostridia bacterium]
MKYKRSIIILMLFVLFVPLLSSCFKTDVQEYESGYYKYSVVTQNGESKAYITGLTESGLEQQYLVYPNELDGNEIYGLGYKKWIPTGHSYIGDIDCLNVKKFYFPTIQRENLGQCVSNANRITSIYWNNIYDNYSIYPGNMIRSGKEVFGYNLFKTKEAMLKKNFNIFYVANVSYLYNYDNAPNDNYYWVDTYNEEQIQFIPPDPVRDGYLFGGWYKDMGCTEKWDFDEDIAPKEIVINRDKYKPYESYTGIYLYAKWTKET